MATLAEETVVLMCGFWPRAVSIAVTSSYTMLGSPASMMSVKFVRLENERMLAG